MLATERSEAKILKDDNLNQAVLGRFLIKSIKNLHRVWKARKYRLILTWFEYKIRDETKAGRIR